MKKTPQSLHHVVVACIRRHLFIDRFEYTTLFESTDRPERFAAELDASEIAILLQDFGPASWWLLTTHRIFGVNRDGAFDIPMGRVGYMLDQDAFLISAPMSPSTTIDVELLGQPPLHLEVEGRFGWPLIHYALEWVREYHVREGGLVEPG